MKKLLAIVVLGFLWSGNAFAKDLKLLCDHTKDGTSEILIMNDKKKSLAVEDVPGINIPLKITNFTNDQINGYVESILKGKVVQRMAYSLDRRTGILNLRSEFTDGGLYFHTWRCKVFNKNKF